MYQVKEVSGLAVTRRDLRRIPNTETIFKKITLLVQTEGIRHNVVQG